MERGTLGGFLAHRPPCKPDLILLDPTRYAHAGIVATLIEAGLATDRTVFVIEDDHWCVLRLSH